MNAAKQHSYAPGINLYFPIEFNLVLLPHIHIGGGAASWVSEYGGCVVASF